MKKMILAAFAITATALSANAQKMQPKSATPVEGQAAVAQADGQKQSVSENDLPDGIKKVLATDVYKDQAFQDAWLISDKTAYYVIHLKKTDGVTELKLDKNGIPVS